MEILGNYFIVGLFQDFPIFHSSRAPNITFFVNNYLSTITMLTQFSPCASTGGRTECKPHLHVNLKIYQVLSIM